MFGRKSADLICNFNAFEPFLHQMMVEKPREFDPRRQATLTPASKNTLTPYGKIKMTPENDCFSGVFL